MLEKVKRYLDEKGFKYRQIENVINVSAELYDYKIVAHKDGRYSLNGTCTIESDTWFQSGGIPSEMHVVNKMQQRESEGMI